MELKKPIKHPKEKTLRKRLWELCKQIIRNRHGNICYTCDKFGLEGSNWQTGHMWPKGALGSSMKYDLRILRPQCYNCNMNLGGMGAVFFARMTKEMGKPYMSRLEKDRQTSKNVSIKADWVWLTGMIEEYKIIYTQENLQLR